jgi:transcription elongation factor Elf1
MTKDEALKMALESMKRIDAWLIQRGYTGLMPQEKETITAIEKALAQPEQEPVALPCCGYADSSAIKWNPYSQVVQCHNCGQVYTTPPQLTFVGLTDEEIDSYFEDHGWSPSKDYYPVIKDIEAKLKEMNND